MNDGYGDVNIPTAGVQQRDTDALECLMALCRIMGLHYRITQEADSKYSIFVSWHNWPTDYFVPCKKDGSTGIVGATNPVEALRSVIQSATFDLIRNGRAFGNGFKGYWLKDTGKEWGVRQEADSTISSESH